jgi:hypothetical protein
VTAPIRLRLSRAKGYRLQAASLAANGLPAVKVDRSTALGNPFVVGRDGTAARCVDLYRLMLAGMYALACGPSIDEQRRAVEAAKISLEGLRGKNLACWCHLGKPCHAEVLLDLANPRSGVYLPRERWFPEYAAGRP